MRTPGVVAAVAACVVMSNAPVLAQDSPRRDASRIVSAPALTLNHAGADGGEPGDLSAAVAGGMSAVLPGAGQFYNGQGLKGGLMIAGFAASLTFALTEGINAYHACSGTHDLNSGLFTIDQCGSVHHLMNYKFWLGMGAASGVYAWSVFDAISVARRRTAETGDSGRGARLDIGPMLRGGEPALGASLRIRH